MNIRNVAIIAHVDHGKTSLVDGLLKQSKTFRENEHYMSDTLIMDSNDQERERGITILAKNTTINYNDYKINIIDTPGHSDFSGEVERTLNMAEGAILVIDAKEGPMPQTKYVLKKALELNLKIIVVINKIDKKDCDPAKALHRTSDLFLDLAKSDHHLDFPVYYAIGRDGKSWENMPEDINAPADLKPIFEAIIKHIPEPVISSDQGFQMLVSSLDYDNYKGKYAIGKVFRGEINTDAKVALMKSNGEIISCFVEKIYTNQGLNRVEIDKGVTGDIVYITGIKEASIGDTITDFDKQEALPSISIEDPTLKISISANTSPFVGREGSLVNARQIAERIEKEVQTNISLKFEKNINGEFEVAGRGELHLSVFLENLRREGYEMQVSKPQVIQKIVDGETQEPYEELFVEVPTEYANSIIGEVAKRGGMLTDQAENDDKTTNIVFEISTRGTLGLRNILLTMSKGNLVFNTSFLEYRKVTGNIPRLRNGVLLASTGGKATGFGLNVAQGRGITYIAPQTEVYEGMIIGLNSRTEDIEINVIKGKQLTNIRASGNDDALILVPPTIMDLEQSLNFIEDDELLEITPKNIRFRKKILNADLRMKTRNKEK
ncbi:MAG: translational GTPase TypA [bacterium]|nr:translational GTPase TypA [bacterium]